MKSKTLRLSARRQGPSAPLMKSGMSEQRTQRAFRAIAGCFFLLGWLIPTLFAQFPTMRENLHIEEWQITVFILTMALGAIPSMIASSWAIGRWGSRRLALFFHPLILIFPVSFIMAPTYEVFLGVGFAMGICSGFFDVVANTQGSLLERVTDRFFMTSIHALFALGVLVGSLLASAAHYVGLPLPQFFAGLTVLSSALFPFIWRDFLPFEVERDQERSDGADLGTVSPRISQFLLLALAVLMVLGVKAEGAHYDWLALYFTDEFVWRGEPLPKLGSNLAMVFFSSGLLLARLVGDGIANRIGRPRLLLFGTLIGLAGLGWLIATSTYGHGLLAAFLIGFGFAFFFPIFVAAAGRLRGIRPAFGVALVSAMGWASIFIGPPLIGFVEHHYGFRWAYASIIPAAAFVAILGPWVVFKSRPGNH